MMTFDNYQRAFWMSFATKFLLLRKEHGLTQPQMADRIGIHLSQVRRYEYGEALPSLDILKKIAISFNVTTDSLIFDDTERELTDDSRLRFEAVEQMDEEERKSIHSLIDAMILKHQAKRLLGQG